MSFLFQNEANDLLDIIFTHKHTLISPPPSSPLNNRYVATVEPKSTAFSRKSSLLSFRWIRASTGKTHTHTQLTFHPIHHHTIHCFRSFISLNHLFLCFVSQEKKKLKQFSLSMITETNLLKRENLFLRSKQLKPFRRKKTNL